MQAAEAQRLPAPRDDAVAPLAAWRQPAPSLVIALATTLAAALFGVAWGTEPIAPGRTLRVLADHLPLISASGFTATEDAIIWDIRAPRVVLAGLVGATLAFCGAAYQGVFRNPLAEPYLIGVAAGASVGATLIIVSPLFVVSGVFSPVPPAAFAGALIAVALAYGLARSGGRASGTSLILSGVTVSSLGTSIVTYLMLSNSDQTREILSWVLGSFSRARWTDAGVALPYMALAFAVVLPYARLLNVLQLDEDEARHLGVDVERVKLIVLAAASLATAAAVAVVGIIGFVGLIVPHAVRLVWGPDYRRLLPLSACFGASFLILADVAARAADAGREVPIGIVTAVVGAPLFLLLLRRYNSRAGEAA